MDHLEETRTREFGVLRQMMTNNADLMKANTAITEKTFNLVGPYIDNLEAMSKFTSALGVIGDSLHWFGDRMIRLAKPVLVIIAALGGCVVAWRAFQSGNLLEALRALVGLF